MIVINQKEDTEIEVREFNDYTLELQQDGVYITCDKTGAKQLIEVLEDWINERA
nr:MAG TPA: hypothetical protein [Caudoviricetes sp.]